MVPRMGIAIDVRSPSLVANEISGIAAISGKKAL